MQTAEKLTGPFEITGFLKSKVLISNG